MSRARDTMLAFTAVVVITSCAPKAAPPVDTTADVAALKAMQDREFAVISSGNIDTILSIYTSNVMLMPPGEPAVNGGDAARKWLEAFLKAYSVSGKYTSAHVEVNGDLGVVHYTGEMTATPKKGGKAMTETIKGVHVYQRQPDGSWKIAQDVWNADAPPPPPGK